MRAFQDSIVILISAFFLQCCQTDTGITIDPLVLNIVSGHIQPGENGERLPNPIVIEVTDSEGNPLENIQMEFSIITGGGVLDEPHPRSDHNGLAETRWTLGTGSHHIMKVSVSGKDYSGEPVYVFAQTEIDINPKWITGISFPWIFGERIEHDNRILETTHFLLYSDESSDDAKIRFAKIAEERLSEVFQAFDLQEGDEVGIIETDQDTKPKLYSNVKTTFPYGGFAFNTGYVYYALDGDTYLNGSQSFKDIYELDVKHETVHTMQFLVGLDNLPNLWPDVWFSEGIAVYISGNRPPFADLEELTEWRQIAANDIPVKVHEWSDLPSQGSRYYQMFGLAVEYLLREDGHGKTTTDVLEMYRYMHASEDGFAVAFEKYMGMSLPYYENNFWDLITNYLASK